MSGRILAVIRCAEVGGQEVGHTSSLLTMPVDRTLANSSHTAKEQRHGWTHRELDYVRTPPAKGLAVRRGSVLQAQWARELGGHFVDNSDAPVIVTGPAGADFEVWFDFLNPPLLSRESGGWLT
jgi:hypothetical protein